MDTERALLSQMRELEPDACAEYLSFVRATIRTNNRLLESSPLPHDNEVTSLYFDVEVEPLSFALAVVLSFGFTIIVNLATNRTLNKIDMVGALKSAE